MSDHRSPAVELSERLPLPTASTMCWAELPIAAAVKEIGPLAVLVSISRVVPSPETVPATVAVNEPAAIVLPAEKTRPPAEEFSVQASSV